MVFRAFDTPTRRDEATIAAPRGGGAQRPVRDDSAADGAEEVRDLEMK
jgi:hypothetical protein